MTKIDEKSQTSPDLSMPVHVLKGVGPDRAKIFGHVGVGTVAELRESVPRDWKVGRVR
jgi:threonine dehydrogenase-like Zn-dependent dehydrogenase